MASTGNDCHCSTNIGDLVSIRLGKSRPIGLDSPLFRPTPGRWRGGTTLAIDGDVMRRDQRGFTIIELLVVVSVISILTLIALTLYANVQSRSRLAKAQADTRTMAGAIGAFEAHMGQMPAVLGDLTVSQTNATGQIAGPFMGSNAVPPAGWTYNYSVGGPTGYTITAIGDSTTITAP